MPEVKRTLDLDNDPDRVICQAVMVSDVSGWEPDCLHLYKSEINTEKTTTRRHVNVHFIDVILITLPQTKYPQR